MPFTGRALDADPSFRKLPEPRRALNKSRNLLGPVSSGGIKETQDLA